MAKRFTDTDKWKDEWYSELEPMMKLLWLYMLDSCDHAGFWKANFKLASFCLGGAYDKQSAMKALSSKVTLVNADKWHIPNFISYQYKGKLNPSNKAHKGVITQLILNEVDPSPFVHPMKLHLLKDILDQRGTGVGVGISSSLNSSSFLKEGNESQKTSMLDQVVQLFNDKLGGKAGRIKSCSGLSGPQIEEFITTISFEPLNKIETWDGMFETVAGSDFLTGQSKGSGWVVTLNWLVVHGNALKVLNGQYAPKEGERTPEANKQYLDSVELN